MVGVYLRLEKMLQCCYNILGNVMVGVNAGDRCRGNIKRYKSN